MVGGIIVGRIFIRRNEEDEYQWHVPFYSRKYEYDEPDGEVPNCTARVYFELKDHHIVEGEIVVEMSGYYTYYDNNWQGWNQILRWKFR